jgi:hypothetical protein
MPQGGWKRRRGGITAINMQQEAVQSELHMAALRLGLLLLLLPLLPPQHHARKPSHAVRHGLHSSQAHNPPHTSVHARRGAGKPYVRERQGSQGRG